MFHIKRVEKIKTYILCLHLSESRTVYEIMSKNIEKPKMPQMTIHSAQCTLHAGQVSLHECTHTRAHTEICNTYCFSPATVVS